MVNPSYINIIEQPEVVDVTVASWYRLGPERLLSKYRVVSTGSFGMSSANLLSLKKEFPEFSISKLTTGQIIGQPQFEELIAKHGLDDYKFITYLPVDDDRYNFMNDAGDLALRFENKAWLREEYSSNFNFPKHSIERSTDLADFNEIVDELGLPFVLQHESFSGGRGTFFINKEENYHGSIERLNEKADTDFKVVSSSFIEAGIERSLQVCITRNNGNIIGPIQSQFVRSSELIGADGSDQFCGGAISEVLQNESFSKEIEENANKMADILRKQGYIGIFGIDFMYSQKQQELFVIEVNARTTGMLPLINYADTSTSMYVLHILEKTNSEYSLDEGHTNMLESPDSSFFVIHHSNKDRRLVNNCLESGVFEPGGVSDLGLDPSNKHSSKLVYRSLIEKGGMLAPGGRVGMIFFDKSIYPETEEFKQAILPLIEKAKKEVACSRFDAARASKAGLQNTGKGEL